MLALPADEIHLWSVRVADVPDSLLASYASLLSPEEDARLAGFVAEVQPEFLVTRALARVVLGRYLDAPPESLVFVTSAGGKPEVAGFPLRFNLANAGASVALAVTRSRAVGVDIERAPWGGDALAMARRFFARSELDDLESQLPDDIDRRYLAYWTLKEAWVKARGTGLQTPLAEVVVHLGAPPTLVAAGGADPARWHLFQPDVSPDDVVALAVEGEPFARPRLVHRALVPLR